MDPRSSAAVDGGHPREASGRHITHVPKFGSRYQDNARHDANIRTRHQEASRNAVLSPMISLVAKVRCCASAYLEFSIRFNSSPRRIVPVATDVLGGKLRIGIQEHLQGFVTQKPDGSLIGPFNALLHFPAYGLPAWDLFLALAGGSVLPKAVRETVILSTGARCGSLYELYSHEALAPKAGLSASKISTLAAGERPSDPTDEEGIGYDVAAVLHRGHQVPNTTYNAAVAAFSVQGVAEIAYLVGCYALIGSLLNTFDVNLPGTELG